MLLKERIVKNLSDNFPDIQDLEVVTEEGACSTASKVSLAFVSKSFDGLSRIDRHRLIHEALAKELEKEIHSISIKVKAPSDRQ